MYDSTSEIKDGVVTLKIATVQFGIVQLLLNGNEMSFDEQTELYDALQSQGHDEASCALTVAGEVKSRQTHKAIIDVCNNEGRWPALVQLVGENPNGWYITFCNDHGIEI